MNHIKLTGQRKQSLIDDNLTSKNTTFSSEKINQLITPPNIFIT